MWWWCACRACHISICCVSSSSILRYSRSRTRRSRDRLGRVSCVGSPVISDNSRFNGNFGVVCSHGCGVDGLLGSSDYLGLGVDACGGDDVSREMGSFDSEDVCSDGGFDAPGACAYFSEGVLVYV